MVLDAVNRARSVKPIQASMQYKSNGGDREPDEFSPFLKEGENACEEADKGGKEKHEVTNKRGCGGRGDGDGKVRITITDEVSRHQIKGTLKGKCDGKKQVCDIQHPGFCRRQGKRGGQERSLEMDPPKVHGVEDQVPCPHCLVLIGQI